MCVYVRPCVLRKKQASTNSESLVPRFIYKSITIILVLETRKFVKVIFMCSRVASNVARVGLSSAMGLGPDLIAVGFAKLLNEEHTVGERKYCLNRS